MAINSLSASSYGLSGLVSGMNSQEMVEKLLTGTQNKIDKTVQKKTVLEYKQQMYRDVSNKLKALQSSYLSFTSSTNLLSGSFYNTMTAAVNTVSGKSAAFSVTASTSAKPGTYNMNSISQLASAYAETTNAPAAKGVSAAFDKATAEGLLNQYSGTNGRLQIQVGDDIAIIEDVPLEFGGKSASEIVAKLNEAFTAQNVAATASFENNKLQIKATNEDDYIVMNSSAVATDRNKAMAMFGSGVTSLSGQGSLSAAIDGEKYLPTIAVNLDGRQENIAVNLKDLQTFIDSGDATDLNKSLSDSLARVFGTGVKLTPALAADGVTQTGFTLETKQTSQTLTITGDYRVLDSLGLKSGDSNKINTTLSIKNLNFATPIQGNLQTFSINGVDFSYDSSVSLDQIITDINKSKAGVKVSYIESEDRFMIQRSETGEVAGDFEFKLEQTSGNLLSAMFGVKGGASATGHGVNMDMVSDTISSDVENAIAYGGTYTFNVNGTDYKFSIKWEAGDELITKEKFAEQINSAMGNAFGYKSDGTRVLTFELKDDKFVIHSNDPDMVVKAVKQNEDTNKSLLGFEVGQSTRATRGDVTLAEAGMSFGTGTAAGLTINVDGTTIAIAADDLADTLTMGDLATLISDKLTAAGHNASVEYDAKAAAFRVAGVDIPMEIVVGGGDGAKGLDNLFGQDSLAVNQAGSISLAKTADGQNAIFKLNGSEMQRSSNSFTIDGMTFTLHGTTFADQTNQSGDHEASQIVVSRDTEKIVEGMTEFLKLYNETVDYINELLRADATYKDYAPLTAKQKAEMSDREIEQWEEKSREGLLRNDQYLERVLQNMRKAMYTKPEGSSIAIYDLGITTSYYTNDGNLNPTSVNDLRSAIEANPEAVQQLFSGEGGIMELLNDAISGATKSSYGNPGYLVQVAGTSAMYTDSTIYKQITELDDQLVTLESRYWREYDRYWKQFNTMEQLIQSMNSQSSWLSQMMSGG